MKETNKKGIDVKSVLHKQSGSGSSNGSDDRIRKLETTVFRFFGFLLGALLTHIILQML